MKLDLREHEIEVIELKAKGFLEKQICDKLFVSIHAVKMRIKRALKRNNLSNGFELVARYAAKHPEIFKKAFIVAIATVVKSKNRIVRVRKAD